MNLVDVSKALANYQAPPGRMRILEGIKHTLILDDTYNSSPQSSLMALGSLKRIELFTGARRFAVLGDMLELGSYTAEGHREVGKFAVQAGVDELVVVGERSVDTMQAAKKAGMAEERIFHFDTSEQAGRFVQDRIKQGDLILVKGSQGMRMEKVVKEIMAEPLRAEELLVRQGPEWKNK
jgi:UDP-N-acetylmuramoyl-tripeptide--D-alanyl-D-alanine ligase